MASSYSRAQTPLRGRGGTKCPHHFGNDVIYVCKNCDNLACMECVDKIHKGHNLDVLSDVIPQIKRKIQDFIDKVEQNEIPYISEKLQAIDGDISSTRQHCQQQINKVKGQNNKLKKELDDITENLVKSYQDMEQESTITLLEHSKELKHHLDDLNSRLQVCIDTLQSGNDVLAYDISKDDICIFNQDVSKPTLTSNLLEFIQADFSVPQLEKLIGEISITKSDTELEPTPGNQSNNPPHQHVTETPKDHSTYQTLKHPSAAKIFKDFSIQQHIDWTVSSQFFPYDKRTVTAMHAAPGNLVWSCPCNYGDNILLLFDLQGNVQQALIEKNIDDFSLSPRNDNIWYTNGVELKEVQGETSMVKFSLQKKSIAICLTNDDHIILGHKHLLAKYTPTGQVISKTAMGGIFRSPQLREPKRITECPVTKNLAVIDGDSKDHGGKKKPYVSILNNLLQPLHNYHGLLENKKPPRLTFNPSDLCYTSKGELVITDWYNNSVIVVNGKGEYVKTLYIHNNSGPKAVCVQKDNTIIVSFDNHSVKVLTHK